MNIKFITALAVLFLAVAACGKGCRDNNHDNNHSEERSEKKDKHGKKEDKEDTETKKMVYGSPYIIENSDYILVPVSLADADENIFNRFKEVFSPDRKQYSSYSDEYNSFNVSDLYNVVIYNKRSSEIYPLLNSKILINKFYLPARANGDTAKTQFMIFTTITSDMNDDGRINNDDGETVYMCKTDGKDIRQVSPEGVKLLSWTADEKGDMIYITVTMDSNMDKEFTYKDNIKVLKTLISNPGMATTLVPDSLDTQLNKMYNDR